MKIKTSSRYLPFYEQRAQLTTEEETLVALLEEDRRFARKVFSLRKEFNIPRDGYPEENLQSNPGDFQTDPVEKLFKGRCFIIGKREHRDILKLAGIKDDYDLINFEVCMFCIDYNLPTYWGGSFALFITFSVLPVPSRLGPITYYSRRDLHRWYVEQSDSVLIAIEQPVSKRQLTNWLDENWKGLNQEVKTLPKHPNTRLPALEKYKLITYLEKKGYKPPQIAEAITDSFGLSDNEVGIYSKRFKNLLKRINR